MIIEALNKYYEMHAKDLPAYGYSEQKVHFCLVLNLKGDLVDIQEVREIGLKNKSVPKTFTLPFAGKRANNINANFLWDNTTYVLGRENRKDGETKPKEYSDERHEAFKKLHKEVIGQNSDKGLQSVINFLNKWNPEKLEENKIFKKMWGEMANANLIFRVDGEHEFIHEKAAAKILWSRYCQQQQEESSDKSFCLVSGENTKIARLHPAIKGIKGAQPTGANIVSFNAVSFESYGKEQGLNSPISGQIAFNYTTAINKMLCFDSKQKVNIGSMTIVFWSEKDSKINDLFREMFEKSQEGVSETELKRFMNAVREGKKYELEVNGDSKFFILGMSPNASRIAIKLWYSGTVKEIGDKIKQHYEDIGIKKQYDNEEDYPNMWWLLSSTTRGRKIGDIKPNLPEAYLKAILENGIYPYSIFMGVLGRVRAGDNIDYYRASVIKGFLNRNKRIYRKNYKEVSMVLDTKNESPGYLLGRAFAVLEKIQKDAIGKESIKERFYGSASSTPGNVFPILFKLSQHHLQKLEGTKVYYEKIMQEIMSQIKNFPKHLNPDEQGLFVVGYYHQKLDLYTKKENKEEKQ